LRILKQALPFWGTIKYVKKKGTKWRINIIVVRCRRFWPKVWGEANFSCLVFIIYPAVFANAGAAATVFPGVAAVAAVSAAAVAG